MKIEESTYNHFPKNESTVDEIYVFCSSDEGGEGIMAASISEQSTTGITPLITASKKLLPVYREIAHDIAKLSKKNVILKKFSSYEVMEVIHVNDAG